MYHHGDRFPIQQKVRLRFVKSGVGMEPQSKRSSLLLCLHCCLVSNPCSTVLNALNTELMWILRNLYLQ